MKQISSVYVKGSYKSINFKFIRWQSSAERVWKSKNKDTVFDICIWRVFELIFESMPKSHMYEKYSKIKHASTYSCIEDIHFISWKLPFWRNGRIWVSISAIRYCQYGIGNTSQKIVRFYSPLYLANLEAVL